MKHEFVDVLPEELKEGVIYVSVNYAIVVHKCACGCGSEVVTPLSSTDWKLTCDGESITLYPSIGNWNFDCKSHYWIRNNKVKWSDKWSESEIELGRVRDREHKTEHYHNRQSNQELNDSSIVNREEPENNSTGNKSSFWTQVKRWVFR
jgi:hypothetical protein